MKDILEQAGIQVTRENKKDLHRIRHHLVGVEYKSCSPTWKGLKALRADQASRRKLVADLRARWQG